MIKEEHLDFWIKHRYNVLLIGAHGVGKTSIIKAAFERNNLKWRYFSASTIDPWVDLIGVPREKKMPDGTSYLDLVRPKDFEYDAVEAVFFDEYNRSHKKVRNAVMELIQFKSINGKPFNNLKIVWAAINPEDEDYDVEKLDPAQQDRFHIQVPIPYKPHKPYFVERYGEHIAKSAISWWSDLPADQKKLVSPRRLDYALDVIGNNGDVHFVLPESSNIAKLLATLENGPATAKLKELRENKDVEGARIYLSSENNYLACIKAILNSKLNMHFFLPCLSSEKLSVLADNQTVLKSMVERSEDDPVFKTVLQNIVDANQNQDLVKRIKKAQAECQTTLGSKPEAPWFSGSGSMSMYPHIVEGAILELGNGKSNLENLKVFDEFKMMVPNKLSTPLAIKTLDFFDHLAAFCTPKALQSAPNLMGLVNHCITQIGINESITTWDKFKLEYGKHFLLFIQLCRTEPNIGNRLWTFKAGA